MNRSLAVRRRPATDYKIALMKAKLVEKLVEMNDILFQIYSIYNDNTVALEEKQVKINELVLRLEKLQYEE